MKILIFHHYETARIPLCLSEVNLQKSKMKV